MEGGEGGDPQVGYVVRSQSNGMVGRLARPPLLPVMLRGHDTDEKRSLTQAGAAHDQALRRGVGKVEHGEERFSE